MDQKPNKLLNFLAGIEYQRLGHKIKCLEFDPRFTQDEKDVVRKYLVLERYECENLMNTKNLNYEQQAKPH